MMNYFRPVLNGGRDVEMEFKMRRKKGKRIFGGFNCFLICKVNPSQWSGILKISWSFTGQNRIEGSTSLSIIELDRKQNVLKFPQNGGKCSKKYLAIPFSSCFFSLASLFSSLPCLHM